MFDPALPAANSPLSSAEMRGQFNALKALIDALPSVTGAQVDAVNTLPPGQPAGVSLQLTGGVLHFTFDLPRGDTGNQGAPGVQGAQGPQGPPFADAVVVGVSTLEPSEQAWADVSFDGTTVHFEFGIPRGNDGADGGGGGGGDGVTHAELEEAISGTSANCNHVSMLTQGADSDYNPSQMQDVLNKLDELIDALRR